MTEGLKQMSFLRCNFLRLMRKIKGRKEDYRYKTNVNSPLHRLKWNALGDSVTNGEIGETNYRRFVAKSEGMLVTNYGIHSTMITKDLRYPETFGLEMSTRYAVMDDDADIITIFGGINDIKARLPIGEKKDRNNTTFIGALHVLLSGVLKKYSGKKIGFITPLNYGDNKALPYINAIKEVCEIYSIPVLDLYDGWLVMTGENRDDLCPDGLHPNTAGHELLSIEIRKFLLTL